MSIKIFIPIDSTALSLGAHEVAEVISKEAQAKKIDIEIIEKMLSIMETHEIDKIDLKHSIIKETRKTIELNKDIVLKKDDDRPSPLLPICNCNSLRKWKGGSDDLIRTWDVKLLKR